MLYRMATLKLERLKENPTSETRFRNLNPVTLLPPLTFSFECSDFFGPNNSQNNSERLIGKGAHLFDKPSYYCLDRATVEV